MGQSKWPLPQKEKKRRVWDAPQLIKSIKMNHNKYNKYLSSCKIYNK
jgi:hypothetical protein